MRTAKYLAGAALLIISLAACGSTPAFNGSRTGNDEQFLLDYTMFNTTDSQELTAQAGDQIRADITVDGGELSVQIQKEGEEPLYSGDGIVTKGVENNIRNVGALAREGMRETDKTIIRMMTEGCC